jgi:lactoylglutathione lyase/methylmalonyl-CoA/ethylmalonyl-CoA epimerase
MSILKKFDHIGIVVDDLQQAIDELSNFFGLECQELMEIKESGIRIAFYPLGCGQMEFIEFKKPIDGVDPMVTQPRDGIQHVAFQVEDFKQAVAQLTAKGLKLIKGFPRQGAHGQVAFFYPTKGLQLLIEICES